MQKSALCIAKQATYYYLPLCIYLFFCIILYHLLAPNYIKTCTLIGTHILWLFTIYIQMVYTNITKNVKNCTIDVFCVFLYSSS